MSVSAEDNEREIRQVARRLDIAISDEDCRQVAARAEQARSALRRLSELLPSEVEMSFVVPEPTDRE